MSVSDICGRPEPTTETEERMHTTDEKKSKGRVLVVSCANKTQHKNGSTAIMGLGSTFHCAEKGVNDVVQVLQARRCAHLFLSGWNGSEGSRGQLTCRAIHTASTFSRWSRQGSPPPHRPRNNCRGPLRCPLTSRQPLQTKE